MADLIDRQELLKHKGNCYDEEGHLLYAVGTGTILLMPTVDAEPVVRCKDCRWQNTPMCWITYRKLLDDYDFCCGGIRKEDETGGWKSMDLTWTSVHGGEKREDEYVIDQQPTVDATTAKNATVGHWIEDGDSGWCSECKCDMPMYRDDWEWKYTKTNYCPNCGAKMDEVTDETD